MTLVQNFMLINNRIETWVWKSTEMKSMTFNFLKNHENHHKETRAGHHHPATKLENISNGSDVFTLNCPR